MPDESLIWFPQLDFPAAPVFDCSQKKVETNLENSEVFAKFSALTSGIDFEIIGGYSWDDDPTMQIAKNPTGLTVTPRHHRLGLAGGSFSSTLGGFVLRGEGAYYNGKYFNSEDPTLMDNTVKKKLSPLPGWSGLFVVGCKIKFTVYSTGNFRL